LLNDGKQVPAFLDPMRINLRELIQQGHSAAEKVVAATKQILDITEQTTIQSKEMISAIEQVASGAESQTQSTAENLKAMEKVSAAIQRIAENAAGISESAVFSKQQAETGGPGGRTRPRVCDCRFRGAEVGRTIRAIIGSDCRFGQRD
jgi:methyl-accepting chemotaxis protein